MGRLLAFLPFSMSQARSGGRVVGSGAGWTDGPFKREIEC